MGNVQFRLRKLPRRAFESLSFVTLIVLLALPFTSAYADDYRYGRGAVGFHVIADFGDWRLGGPYRHGGYEIWRWYRGGWRRRPEHADEIGGDYRHPWVINYEGERSQ